MDWQAWRAQMPVTRHWVFLDHAAVAPISALAQRALTSYAADVAEHGGVHVARWEEEIERVRRLVARLLNADPLDVAFVKNTSEGIGIVAEGLDWHAGDNVVIAEEEYPANVYPWMNLAHRGVEVRRVASRGNRLHIDDLAAALDRRTRLVSLSFVEFASGFRNDIDRIGSLCRERGILFFVDAIQGLGVLPLDVRASPVDFLAADGHKWLLGPEGAGIFWIRRELVERLHPVGIGWNSVVGSRDFCRIDFTLKPHAGRWESGTLNVGGISALGASIELLLSVGLKAIEQRVLYLTDLLCESAARAGLQIWSSRQPGDRSGIVSLVVPGVNPRAVVRACRGQGIAINHRAGRIRVSPHGYNQEDEIEYLVATLRRHVTAVAASPEMR
ncbi:MAG: aminotransferase class V-fold PLP-dependent enzyme [Gemmataceae bacterium]|nr:aminotransferase class V-fold PLP-dependent enzyme [Gemmataceae bacterium]MDW8267085.1 aminotransferase class V-fold PLP-dependent enzyme [Gemmataceae bacterium]